MDNERLEEFCRSGERADTFLRQGRARDALKVYLEMISKLEKAQDIDSYLLAKLTLGVLRCYVKLADFKSAFQVWNAHIEDGYFGLGIYALESAQTTVNDMIAYDMLCGFLHTLADAKPLDAASAVNTYLSRVCEHCVDEADKKLLRMALSNWKQHLKDIFPTTIPHDFAIGLIKYEKQLGEPVKPEPIDFPFPTAWEKPADFREMSRVVLMKNSKAKPTKRKVG